MLKKGTVVWITGLSGAGKTTAGKLLTAQLREKNWPVVFLDGDKLRQIFKSTNYSVEERYQLSLKYGKLFQAISDQGIHVIIATISMFHKTHAWNRKHIKNYVEVYLKVPLEILTKRDSKFIYSPARENKQNNAVGLDLNLEEPLNPELIINNYGESNPEITVKKILTLIMD